MISPIFVEDIILFCSILFVLFIKYDYHKKHTVRWHKQ